MSTSDPHRSDARATGPSSVSEARTRELETLRLLIPKKRSRAVRYGGAIAGVLVATALTHLLLEQLTRTVFTLFWPIVIGSAWAGGLGPAVLASVLSVLLADYLLIPPYREFNLTRPEDIFPLVIFLVVTFMISYLVDATRRAQTAAAEYAAGNAELATKLAVQAQDLAMQLEESQALSEELEQAAEESEERSVAAEGMGGTLTATSEVGKGSTFQVTLPRAL